MLVTITLVLLVLFLLVLLLLRPSPTFSTPRLIPVSPQSRHVSFSALSLSAHRIHKRRFSAPDSPLASVDQFGRILPSSPTLQRRFSAPLRLSLNSRRRSSRASCTSTSTLFGASPSSSPFTTQSAPPRTRFANPFARSRALSPSNRAFKSPPTPPGLSSPLLTGRRTLANKLKSILKPVPRDPPPAIRSKPFFATINTKLRRKPVARTQPYGPPWNAPMPGPDCAISLLSLQKPYQTVPPHRQPSGKHSGSRSEATSTSPSPHTFINELDEKLSLLRQHQRIQEIPLTL